MRRRKKTNIAVKKGGGVEKKNKGDNIHKQPSSLG